MAERARFASHEAYFASVPAEVRTILLEVRAVVEAALPAARRCIGYNMPAFRDGRIFFYFAGFRQHLGIYPPLGADAALTEELAPYRNEKGNLAFKYRQPIPYPLIARVALALHREYAGTR